MPAKKPQRVRTRDQAFVANATTPEATERALDEVARILTGPLMSRERAVLEDVSLVVGDNRINHNLGRKPRHVTLMPTVADATFAWAVTLRDDRQMVIAIIGVAQPHASLEVS